MLIFKQMELILHFKQTKMLLFFRQINMILISRRRGDLALEEAEVALDRQADGAVLECHANRARYLSSGRGSLKQRELIMIIKQIKLNSLFNQAEAGCLLYISVSYSF